jgi:diguanylate cyclase (GGDEF)-like protein
VRVVILPPWWRSTWFFALCTLLFLSLFWAGDRLRARHLRLQARQLSRMVRERTLELEERTRELEASRELLRIQAAEDGLTGMLNHVAILRALTAEMDRARRENKTLVLAMADLDHFKRVNDVYGHLAGDEALRTFATAVGAAIRTYDHSGRYGGEEFLLVLTEIPREGIECRLKCLHASITGLDVVSGEFKFKISCSIGATVYDPSGPLKTVESLLSVADQALYAAKEAGRDRVVFREAESVEAAKQS